MISQPSSEAAVRVYPPREKTLIQATGQHVVMACSDHFDRHIREMHTFNAGHRLVLSEVLLAGASPRQYRVGVYAIWQRFISDYDYPVDYSALENTPQVCCYVREKLPTLDLCGPLATQFISANV